MFSANERGPLSLGWIHTGGFQEHAHTHTENTHTHTQKTHTHTHTRTHTNCTVSQTHAEPKGKQGGQQVRESRTYRKKMTHGDGEADGEGHGAADVRAASVDGREHDDDEHEGDEQLDAEALPRRHALAELRRPERRVLPAGHDGAQQRRPHDGAQALHEHVADEAHPRDLARDDEAEGDGRVDVASAGACRHPDHRGDAQPEAERDLHRRGGTSGVSGRQRRAARGEHEEEGPDELRQQRHVELALRQLLQPDAIRHGAFWSMLPSKMKRTNELRWCDNVSRFNHRLHLGREQLLNCELLPTLPSLSLQTLVSK